MRQGFAIFVVFVLVSCGSEESKLIPVLIDQRVGYIDAEGKFEINPQFDEGRRFHSGLAAVRLADKWGFIDEKGSYRINPQFDRVGAFSDDLAWFANGERYGYVDPTGKIIINPQFDAATDFADGLAAVRSANRWGYVKKDGKFAINAQFDQAERFSEGLAAVRVGQRWGFIDDGGKLKINPQFDQVLRFTEGRAAFLSQGRVGFINEEGKIIIAAQFESATTFHNGRSVVRTNGRYGVIGKDGKIVVNPQFDRLRYYNAGMIPVQAGQKWGYTNEKGEIAIQPQFDDAQPFASGLAAVRTGGRWGFVDRKGTTVVNPQFDAVFLDDTELNELKGKLSLLLGLTISGDLSPATGETSIYTLKLAETTPVMIRAIALSSSIDAVIVVRNAEGIIARDGDGGDTKDALVRAFLAAGEYVIDLSSSGGVGPYSLAVEDAAKNTIREGETKTGRLAIGETALYKLQLGTRSPVTIRMNGDGSGLDPQLLLADGSGKTILTDDDSGGQRNSRIRSTLEPGKYYIGAAGYKGTAGAYTISIGGVDPMDAVQQTLADLRSVATALEARATDYNSYIAAGNVDELAGHLQPTYIRQVPLRDGWNRPWRYMALEGGQGYAFASAGSDGVFQVDLSNLGGTNVGDDIVFSNGNFIYAPPNAQALTGPLAQTTTYTSTDTMVTDSATTYTTSTYQH